MAEWIIIEPIVLSDHSDHVLLKRAVILNIVLYVNCALSLVRIVLALSVAAP